MADVRFVRVIRVIRVSRVCPGSPRCLFTGTLRKLRARQLVCSEEAFACSPVVPGATAPSASLVPTTCLLYFGTYRYRTYRSGKPLNTCTSSPLPIGGHFSSRTPRAGGALEHTLSRRALSVLRHASSAAHDGQASRLTHPWCRIQHGDQQWAALGDYIQAALMLKYNERAVG